MMEGGERALAAAGIDFDPDSGDVRGPDGTSRLAPQPAALFELLARRAGDIVTREELKDHLWPGGRVEFDQGIAFALREVRKTLEEVGADPTVVETLPRRGLRLRAPDGGAGGTDIDAGGTRIEVGAPGAATPAPGESATQPESAAAPSRRPTRVGWIAAGLVVALGLAVAGGLRWGAGSAGPPVLVVFPYAWVEAGGDGTGAVQGSAGEAIAEATVAALTSALEGRAGVVGPAGLAELRGPEDVEGARSALGACLVLSGSVRWSGPDSIVVFTQIVRTSDRVHVWAERDTVQAESAAADVAARVVDGARGALAAC